MTDNLHFKHLSNPFHRVPVHNITLLNIQPADAGTATLTVEYQGSQTVLLGSHWCEVYRSYVGQVGYIVPATPYASSLPGDPAVVQFRPYADQSLRRVYELDCTNDEYQMVPLNFGPFPHHRAHRICAWRCDARPDGFVAPAGLIPGPEGRFVADETEVVSVRVPPEFVLEARRVQMKPVELLESFIGDVSGIHNFSNNPRADRFGSNGSDERDMAAGWLERAHGMNAIDLGELAEREEEAQEWEDQRGEWEDLLCTYADRGGNAVQLLDVISTLVDKLENSGPEVLLKRLRTLTRDE